MTVSASQLQALILLEVGDTITGPVGLNITILWDLYVEKRSVAPRLQYLYTRKHAIEIMMGQLRDTVTFESDRVKFYNAEQQSTLARLLERTFEEITKIEKAAASLRTPVSQELTAKSPIDSNSATDTVGMPDASARRYRGDPYYSNNSNKRIT